MKTPDQNKKNQNKNAASFRFRDAVREACANYPRETKNITFIDMATPDAQDKFVQAFGKCGAENRKIALKNSGAESPAEFFEIIRTTAGPAVFSDDITGRRIVMIDSKNEGALGIFPAQFIFDHELGHAVVPESCPSPRINQKITDVYQHQAGNMLASLSSRAETAADVFAALHGLRRGTLTADDIEEISLFRTKYAAEQKLTHLTVQGLDALLNEPSFESRQYLSPREIAIHAEYLADKNAVPAGEIPSLYFSFTRNSLSQSFNDTACAIVRNAARCVPEYGGRENAVEYYASRILRHAFETDGLHYAGQLGEKLEGKYWDFKFECLRNNVDSMGRSGAMLMPRKNPKP